MKAAFLFGFALALALCLALVFPQPQQAQQLPQAANPAPNCKATPAQLEANKKQVIQFYTGPNDQRIQLIDNSWKQHNPAFVKRAQDAKISDYDEFKATFGPNPNRPAGGGGGNGGGRGGAAAGPRPPQGNQFEIVMAECDFVTVIHKTFRQDPTAAPGTFYEAFSFDTFRVGANGKFVEHWDSAQINPPAAAAAPAGGAAR